MTYDDLDDQALDRLPYGIVGLVETVDGKLQVVRMNKAESEASGIQRWRAIGRDYFSDVAPGPTNQALAEHIRAFPAGKPSPPVSHTFKRRAGADKTQIELVRGRDTAVYLRIKR
jgi:hypothetical protein